MVGEFGKCGRATLAHEGIGIEAGRNKNATTQQSSLQKNLERAHRGLAPGGIAVETCDHIFGVAAQDAELLNGQSSAAARDCFLETRLPERDHVEISLDQNCAVFAAGRRY